MRDLWCAASALYLPRIRGCHRAQNLLDRGFRCQIIPDEIYASPKKLDVGSCYRLLPAYVDVDEISERMSDLACDVSRLSLAANDDYDLVRLFALDLPPEFRRKIVFQFRSLDRLLRSVRFRDVRRLGYRKEHPSTLGIIDDTCSLFSLNVVAVKC